MNLILEYFKWIYWKIENILWNFRDSRKLWHIYQFRTQCEEINAISRRMQLLSLSPTLSLYSTPVSPSSAWSPALEAELPRTLAYLQCGHIALLLYHRRIWQAGINWLILIHHFCPFVLLCPTCTAVSRSWCSPRPAPAPHPRPGGTRCCCTAAAQWQQLTENSLFTFWEYISDWTCTLRCLLVLQTSQ